MKNYTFIFLVVFLASGFSLLENLKEIEIQWVENLDGDYSFYPKQSLRCEAWCYEFAGTSKIESKRISKDSIECRTLPNSATHATLHFYIVNDLVKNARIELNSIVLRDGKSNYIYSCNEGWIKIDKQLFNKGILKAEFDMKFDHPENLKKLMYWKGKIVTKIE